MKLVILDVISKVSQAGNPYTQAAIRGTGKNGDFLFVATVPDDLAAGEVLDRKVVFSKGGNFVLPY